MKFITSSVEFNAAARVVVAACPSRTTQDILYSIKVECEGGVVRMISTDNMHTVVRCVEGAEVVDPGVSLLPSKIISKIASQVSGHVSVESTDTGVLLKCGGDRFRINTEPPQTHPAKVPSLVRTDYCHVFATASVVAAIKRTSFATNQVHHRYALSGIALDFPVSGDCYMVATDGRRSSAARLHGKSYGSHSVDPASTVVPIHGMKVLLSAMLASSSENVWFSCGSAEIVVNADDFLFSSRLVEGRFPSPWRSFVLPDGHVYGRGVCECGDLLAAVKKSDILTETESRGVDVEFSEGSIVLSKHVMDCGASRIEIQAEGCSELAEIKTNASYLREWLSVMPTEEMLTIHYPTADGLRFHLSAADGSVYAQGIMTEAAVRASGV